LAGLFAELEVFAEKKDTRISTLEKRLETFDSLRNRAELYERLLGFNLEDLKSRVKEAENGLAKMLVGMAPA
jgi:hypothetical protein